MSDINPYYYSWREISIEQWCDILQNHEITTQECIDILKVVGDILLSGRRLHYG